MGESQGKEANTTDVVPILHTLQNTLNAHKPTSTTYAEPTQDTTLEIRYLNV